MRPVEFIFVSPEDVEKSVLTISGEAFRHLRKVLRLGEGDVVRACDGEGWIYQARIRRVAKDHICCRIERREYRPERFASPVILGQGMSKGRKMDLIVQKATELGAAGVIALSLARSVPKPDDAAQADRLSRWRMIAREAAQQCGRVGTPTIGGLDSLDDFIKQTAEQPLKVVLWEGERENSLKDVLRGTSVLGGVALLVGPEGGLEAQELERAVEAEFIPVSMGQRKLRTETAALAALAIVQYEIGGMG